MEKASVLISVIVPIFNISPFLKECIESITKQTYRNLEIILVNDGSTDDCGSICDSYSKIDDRIIVIHKKNGGLITARKAGLEISSGEYVAYIDGDDWVEPEFFEVFISHAIKNKADIVVGGHKENLAGRVEVLHNTIKPGIYAGEELKTKVFGSMLYNGKFSQFGIFSYVWGKLYRRSVLYKNQIRVDDRIFIGEDAACLYPTILDSEIVCIIDSAHYHYRQRVDSLIKTPKRTEVLKISTFYSYLKEQFVNRGYQDILVPQLQFFTLSLLTVRSEGPLQYKINSKQLYPFNNVKEGDRVVICGAGTFGQHLYKRLLSNKMFTIVGWIDEWYEYYNILGLNIKGYEAVHKFLYDSIVIAFIDESISEEVTQKLINLGVPAKKIIQVSHYERMDAEELLLEYGIS